MHGILIAAAVLPAIFLLVRIYRADKLEHEPPRLILQLVLLGILSTLLATAAEEVGQWLLVRVYQAGLLPYLVVNLLLYFVVVALSEEGFKYLVLYRRTWRSPEFNCRFDGVVYAVSVSLGFALWENIIYVLRYGLVTALLRAITAVPGHASFGVFMGVWYGAAKSYEVAGQPEKAKRSCRLAVVVPTLLHGCYDFIATMESELFSLIFFAFIIVVFVFALRLVRVTSRNDTYLE